MAFYRFKQESQEEHPLSYSPLNRGDIEVRRPLQTSGAPLNVPLMKGGLRGLLKKRPQAHAHGSTVHGPDGKR